MASTALCGLPVAASGYMRKAEGGRTSKEGETMCRAVIQLVPEEQQAAHKQDGKHDGAPKPPVLSELLPETLAECGWTPRHGCLGGEVGVLLISAWQPHRFMAARGYREIVKLQQGLRHCCMPVATCISSYGRLWATV